MWNETKNRYGRYAADHGDPAVQRISDIRDRIDQAEPYGDHDGFFCADVREKDRNVHRFFRRTDNGPALSGNHWIQCPDLYDDDIKTPLLLIGICDLAYGLCQYAATFLIRGRIHLFFYLRRIIIPEVVYTLLVTLVIYRLIYRINQWLAKSDKRSMDRFA